MSVYLEIILQFKETSSMSSLNMILNFSISPTLLFRLLYFTYWVEWRHFSFLYLYHMKNPLFEYCRVFACAFSTLPIPLRPWYTSFSFILLVLEIFRFAVIFRFFCFIFFPPSLSIFPSQCAFCNVRKCATYISSFVFFFTSFYLFYFFLFFSNSELLKCVSPSPSPEKNLPLLV